MMIPINPVQLDSSQPIQPYPERKNGPSEKSESAAGSPSVRVELGADYQRFLQEALQTESSGSQAVLEAQNALEKGLLDSPQAAREAAEAILRFGV